MKLLPILASLLLLCAALAGTACTTTSPPAQTGHPQTLAPDVATLPVPIASLDQDAAYSVNRRALKRWAEERLSIDTNSDGTLDALFRYEGTTCTNMGRPLAFDYAVKLGPREQGYPILDQRCMPAAGDTGHTKMCQFLVNPSRLMSAIDREKPLNGEKLNAVLAWKRKPGSAGCYCEAASRDHKWGLVLETIHFALAQKEIV